MDGTIYYNNIYSFSRIYNETQFSNINLMSKINVIKQYFYNNTITNFNYPESSINKTFWRFFMEMSDQLGEMIIYTTSKMGSGSLLYRTYRSDYKIYFYSDFSKYIENIDKNDIHYLSNKTKNGFKQINMEIYEILRFLCIQYFINSTRDENYISELAFDLNWINIDQLIVSYVRPWYTKIFNILDSSFVSYVYDIKVIYIFIYAVFLFLISLYYWIIWKKYEDTFINLIKKSFDLINLIPEEIKNIIVIKLND